MLIEKPSCIKEIKKLANSLSDRDTKTTICMTKIEEILKNDDLSSAQKITKLKEICKINGK
jgi:hypothetical protein